MRLRAANARVLTAPSIFRRRSVHSMESASLFDVEGKAAVVTGGSRGIGYMIAEVLVRNGVRTYITARKAAQADSAAVSLSELGGAPCKSIPADLSTEEGIASFAAAIAQNEANGLDILINNAGAAWGAPLDDFPAAGFDKVLSVNVRAPFLLTQALLPLLRKAATANDPARVVNIGSIDGICVPEGHPLSFNYSYSASKAGLHMLSRHLAAHLAGDHVNVNTIAPGPFVSSMTKAADMTDWAQRTPRGRIGTPEDIGGATLFLCSRASAWLTGITLPVDGGISTKAA